MELHRKKRVLLLYTGGTMGMKPTADGSLAPETGFLTTAIKELPEMSRPEMPDYDIKEYSPLLDSSCMGPGDWANIANDIEANYESFDGFVVIMGTDTMAYAASALSFMLENLGKTVVFTGSQIPFFEVYNDARRNLIVSVIFASMSEFPEVCICFNDKLLRANRTVKVNSMGLNAFDSPNFPPLATLGAFIHEHMELALPQPKKAFKVHKTLEARVIVIKLVPGFDDMCIRDMVQHSSTLRALVLEMYGTGNGPSNRGTLLEAIQLAKGKGIVVVAISQCLQGGVSLDTYTMGREFKNAGVVSGGDMTTEACTTKLAYIFGLGITDTHEVSHLLLQSLRGEISSSASAGKKFFKDHIHSSSTHMTLNAKLRETAKSSQQLWTASSSSSSSLNTLATATASASIQHQQQQQHLSPSAGEVSVSSTAAGAGGLGNSEQQFESPNPSSANLQSPQFSPRTNQLTYASAIEALNFLNIE